MASLTSSSCRSSSSYRSSSRYSTSSSYRSESSLGSAADPPFEPFADSAGHSSLLGEEAPRATGSLAPFSRCSRSSFGHTGSAGSATESWQNCTDGGIHCAGDCYYVSVDVGRFEPHDIVVMAYKHHVVIHAQKVLEDGSVSDTFTNKSLLPEDMDPLSVGGTLGPDGTLVVSVRRVAAVSGGDPLLVPTHHSEAHLRPVPSQ